jgi:hypothetical protein
LSNKPESGQIPEYGSHSANSVICGVFQFSSARIASGVPKQAGDVFKKDSLGLDFFDDAGALGPYPALVIGAAALAGNGVGLAWKTGSDEMNASTPWAAVKGSEIVPPSKFRERSLLNARGHPRRDTGFPFNHNNGAVAINGGGKSFIQSEGSSTKGHAEDFGAISHMVTPQPETVPGLERLRKTAG